MRESANLAARAARWSAAHRKAAVIGWLVFVIGAFMIGNAAGMVTLKNGEKGNGQSRLAEQTLAKQFPRERAEEQVLAEYLPKQLSDEELVAIVTAAVAEAAASGAEGPRAMGAVMKLVNPKVKGLAEGGRVAAVVKQALNG